MGAPKTKKNHTIASLQKRIVALEEQVQELLKLSTGKTSTERTDTSIQKVESFNGEEIPAATENLRMNSADKVRSMENVIKILPPNYIEDGRHSITNISAVCGFEVTQEMHDDLYSRVKHQAGLVVDIK
jgi:hypothetical protein